MARDEWVRTADAVIVGGGATGVSTLYQLARRRVRAVLLERHFLAAGGTGRSTAILRQHYAQPALIRMARRSLEIFQHFDQAVGGEAGYVRTGYVMLVGPEQRETLEANVALQRKEGVDARLLSLQELRALHGTVITDDIGGVAYESDGGYADPVATTQAYADRARELGARIFAETEVVGFSMQSGRVREVRTSRGDIATNRVLNAGGLWAAQLAKMVGLEVPVRLGRHLVVVLERPRELHGLHPIYADRISLAGFRPEGGSLLLVGSNEPIDTSEAIDPDNYEMGVGFETILAASAKACRRFAGMEQGRAWKSYAGLFDISEDWNFIVDEAPGIEGYFIATGFSGHGFKHCPALGEMLACFMLEGRKPEDLVPFRLARFGTNPAVPRAVYPGLPMV